MLPIFLQNSDFYHKQSFAIVCNKSQSWARLYEFVASAGHALKQNVAIGDGTKQYSLVLI